MSLCAKCISLEKAIIRMVFTLAFIGILFLYFKLSYPASNQKLYSYLSQTSRHFNQSSVIVLSNKSSTFLYQLLKFTTKEQKDFLYKNSSNKEHYITALVNVLTDYLVREPTIPINSSCKVPSLLEPSEINCTIYPKAFASGKMRNKPAKIAHLIQFGFDVDVLEIHLRELYDIVDYFFILESTRSHRKHNKKSLIWEKVKTQERFQLFSDKIVHIIMDDISSSTNDDTNIWDLEFTQERRRWTAFLEWNEKSKYFCDTDTIGFGDTDEVPSRTNIQLLKYCEVLSPVDIGIWFPMGAIDQAFQSGWPITGYNFTLGDPTFWPLGIAKRHSSTPTRMRGRSGNYLLGGMHMSAHRYLPYLLIKTLTCTECNPNLDMIRTIINFIEKKDIFAMESFFGEEYSVIYKKRIFPINIVDKEIKDVMIQPWFYACNKERYPYWERKHDTRLD
jgi:hypothetical protein